MENYEPTEDLLLEEAPAEILMTEEMRQQQLLAEKEAKKIELENTYPHFFNYEKASQAINALIADWHTEHADAEMRRKERYANVDIPSLRKAGKLLKDETFTANRVIHGNICKEKADTLAYLNNGFRLGIFECKSKPEIQTLRLDIEVTQGLTYLGWQQEYDRVIDGAALHKYDSMEVVYDSTKPLNVGHEHVGFDNLFFDRCVDDINKSARVLRKVKANISILKKLQADGFNEAIINDFASKHEENNPNREIDIYKVFFIVENCCYVAWWTQETTIKAWLKEPEKLFLGIVDAQTGEDAEIDSYPIIVYTYLEDEQKALVDKKGRAFLDGPEQEATTAIKTGYVNRLVRSSNVYGSIASDTGESAEMRELDIKLRHGLMYSTKVDFFSIDPPDVSTLGALQYFQTQNAEQLGKTAYTVVNRDDSRKTAEELKTAQADEQKQVGAKLTTFSEFLRKILTFSWKIIQSQALQGKITLLLTKQEVPTFEGNPQAGMQVVYQNDFETLSQTFDIRPAGDTDVVQAAQEINKMQQDWPVFQAFPGLMQVFVPDYIKYRYPKRAQEYITAFTLGDPLRAALASIITLLKGFMSPEEVMSLSPEQQQQVMMQIQNAEMMLNAPMQQAAGGQTAQPPQNQLPPKPQEKQKQLSY